MKSYKAAEMTDDEIDPGIVLELLPNKIGATRRVIQELRLDISVLSSVETVPAHQLESLRTSLRMHEAILEGYQKRYDALLKAAGGL